MQIGEAACSELFSTLPRTLLMIYIQGELVSPVFSLQFLAVLQVHQTEYTLSQE